jgi:hypothetical protein
LNRKQLEERVILLEEALSRSEVKRRKLLKKNLALHKKIDALQSDLTH